MTDRAVDRAGLAASPRLSPVIRALRFAGEEVQLGSVLEAICQDTDVAQAFCAAILTQAQGGNAAARRSVRRKHGEVACLGEQRLQVRISRRLARARAADAGRVDLRFGDGADWKLAVELKLGATFGHKQLERYVRWGPVAAVVRDAAQIRDTERLRVNTNWVGAVTWRSLVDDLHGLPVDVAWKDQWRALLDVVESDGDFDLGAPDLPEIDAQTKLLGAVSERLRDHLADRLRTTYGKRAEGAVDRLKAKPVTQDRVWAGFVIQAADHPLLYIAIRNLFSDQPRLRVEHYTFHDKRSLRELREAHTRIRRKGFDPVSNYFRFERPLARLRGATADRPDKAFEVIAELITTLVRSRAFDVAIDDLESY